MRHSIWHASRYVYVCKVNQIREDLMKHLALIIMIAFFANTAIAGGGNCAENNSIERTGNSTPTSTTTVKSSTGDTKK